MKSHASVCIFLFLLLLYHAVSAQVSTTISKFRAGDKAIINQPVILITDRGREGLFYLDPNDMTSADNNGTILVQQNKRYRRAYTGAIDARWFGMKADWDWKTGSDNTDALMAAIHAARHREKVVVPSGRYYIANKIILQATKHKKVLLDIYGDIFFGKDTGIIVEGEEQYIRCFGMLAGAHTGATTEMDYRQYTGAGLHLKNLVNSEIFVNEIKDFLYGIHLSSETHDGRPGVSNNNRIHFNDVHHNYTQIRISTRGKGSVNNGSSWHGGQLGRGKAGTYGRGGWHGITMSNDDGGHEITINAHTFYDAGLEGLENGITISHGRGNKFIGGRFEGPALRNGIDLDPVTAVGNSFIGHFAIIERYFVKDRIGSHTMINGTPMWTNPPNQVIMGAHATNSIDSSRFLVRTNRYGYTNFIAIQKHDLISMTGQYPTLEAMKYRVDSVVRAVPYMKTFYHLKKDNQDSVVVLPPNIGLVRIEAEGEKKLVIDSGDLVRTGEYFIVEYLTPEFPVSFIRSGDRKVVMRPYHFKSAGTYQCFWIDEQFKPIRIGGDFKTYKQTEQRGKVPDDIETYFVQYSGGPARTELPPATLHPGKKITIKNLEKNNQVVIEGISPDDENVLGRRSVLTVISNGRTWNVIAFFRLPPEKK